MRNFSILNEYKESDGKQTIFTCLFCLYWVLNATLGLFIVNQYGSYLEEAYEDLTTYIMMFALKWFSSIALALSLIFLISLGSAVQCFTGDIDEIKASIVGMALPIYFFCVVLQQIYATSYGIWFF